MTKSPFPRSYVFRDPKARGGRSRLSFWERSAEGRVRVSGFGMAGGRTTWFAIA